MKKILLLFAALALVFVACDKDEIEPGVDPGTQTAGENYLAVELELPTETQVRNVGITTDKTSGIDPNTGNLSDKIYRYIWTQKQTLHVYFTGKDKDDKKVQRDTTMTFTVPTEYNTESGLKTLELKIPVPHGMIANKVDSIAGAIGVKSMNEEGVCTVESELDKVYTQTNTDYDIPLYFPKTKVKNGRAEKVVLKTYGVLFRVELKYSQDASIFKDIHVKTSLIATDGTFDLKTSKITIDPDTKREIITPPTFAAVKKGAVEKVYGYDSPTDIAAGEFDYQYTTSRHYKLNNFTATDGAPAVFYIWGYPSDNKVVFPTKGNNNDQYSSYTRALYITTTSQGKSNEGDQTYYYMRAAKGPLPIHNVAYPFSATAKVSPMVFTEMIYESGTVSYWEIYNPGDVPVKLKNYWLYDALTNEWVDLTDNRNLTFYNTEGVNTSELGPKKTLVIANSGADGPYNVVVRNYWYDSSEILGVPIHKDGSPYNKVTDWYIKLPVQDASGHYHRFGHIPSWGRRYIAYRQPGEDPDKPDPNALVLLGDCIDSKVAGPNASGAWITMAISSGFGMVRQPSYNTPRTIAVAHEWANHSNFIYEWNANLGARWWVKGMEVHPGAITHIWGKDPALGDNYLVDPD